MSRRTYAHRRLLPRSIYAGLLLGLIACEFPFNQSAFQVFGLPRIETALMAVGVGIGLVGIAHFIGVTLARVGTVRNRARAIVEGVLGVGLFAVLVLGVAHLGHVRTDFLTAAQHGLDLPIRLSETTFASFTFIQYVIVIAAIGAAFFAHNETADELERGARALRRTFRRKGKTKRALIEAEKRFLTPQARREMIFAESLEDSASSAAWYEFLRHERHSANLRHHIEGPKSTLLRPVPPIPPGAWTGRSLGLHRLPNETLCPVVIPRRPKRRERGK